MSDKSGKRGTFPLNMTIEFDYPAGQLGKDAEPLEFCLFGCAVPPDPTNEIICESCKRKIDNIFIEALKRELKKL